MTGWLILVSVLALFLVIDFMLSAILLRLLIMPDRDERRTT